MNFPEINIQLKRLENGADLPVPEYETTGSAGMDVRAAKAMTLASGERAIVPTGFAMAIPEGYEVQVRPRSGLAIKKGISVPNSPGTIDSDYRGELGVILINHSDEDFIIERGDRIAQIVAAPVQRAKMVLVDELDKTSRGAGGFGSTGV